MRNRLRISLVIPAYNEERYLFDCLQSVVAQDIPFWEIIVVDNASNDLTAVVAQQFPGVRIIGEAKRGIVHARNTGFNAARGDIIARIDADTVLPADWTRHITEFYADDGNQGAAWTGNGWFSDVPFSRLVSATYNLLAFRSNQLLIGMPTLWGSNMALPRRHWLAVAHRTCDRNGLHEDLDLTIHLRDAGVRIYYDKHFPVVARLRRATGDRHELWDYLQWWPRTQRVHGYKTWRICWLIGVLPIYLATPLLSFAKTLRHGTAQLLASFEA